MPGKCQRCKRQVYAAEERLALSGSSWHQECFTCAVCNKSLDSTTVTENRENQEIYCKNCYRIHFAIPGYGYGPNKPTLVANSPPLEDCYDVTPSSSKTSLYHARTSTKPIVETFVHPPSWKGTSFWTKKPRVKHYSHQVIAGAKELRKCNSFESMQPTIADSAIIKSTPKPIPRPTTTRGYKGPPPNPQKSRNADLNLNDGPFTATIFLESQVHPSVAGRNNFPKASSRNRSGIKTDICAKCSKPVYFNERKFGYHGVYHPQCFVCASCNKSLDSTTVSENSGQLFCKGCYKRYVATDGVGYGLGAGALQTR